MKSAYVVLGIPGNASNEEIEAAFQKCRAHYPKEKLTGDPEALARFNEISDAYRMLRNAEFRAAYDRKLSGAVRQAPSQAKVIIEREDPPWFSKPLNVMAIAVIALGLSGVYISYSRVQERKVQAARELAQQQKEAAEALQAQQQREKEEADRVRQLAESDRRERQLRMEGTFSAAIAANADAQRNATFNRQQDAERRETLRREQEAKQAEHQRVYESERRVARDKQTLRELCYQRYGRPDC